MSEASKSSGSVPFTKITADRYISPDYMLQEREKLWAKTWLVAGVVQDVEEPAISLSSISSKSLSSFPAPKTAPLMLFTMFANTGAHAYY